MKKLLCILSLSLLCGCSAAPQPTNSPDAGNSQLAEAGNAEITQLPKKAKPESTLISDSELNALNIDDYLFIKDVMYVDLRDPQQLLSEGTIAGFTNIPFYGLIVDLTDNENVLFTMTKPRDENGKVLAQLGDVNSFVANYKESESNLNYLFPKDKQIVVMSTAGVEATYMMNLLIQLGYDPANLYNAGCFSNGIGDQVAYRNVEQARYYTPGHEAYTVSVSYDWGELTPID